jgi:hypothetical protein
MRYAKNLLIGIVITLTGCVTCPTKPIMPIKPVLSPTEMKDGSLLFSRDDAVKLGVYVIELESGYEP